MDTTEQNSNAWDKKVEEGSRYTKSVSSQIIKKSKNGEWDITVTTEKSVPRNWFPESLQGLKILCLASGGGQQGPILAAAGADVTVTDISKKQLAQDETVALRDGLILKTVQADMSDLSEFENEYFDLVVNPVSNLFVKDVRPVWSEVSRVLKNKGILIAGFTNPLLWIFDDTQERKGILDVKHSIPSSTLDYLPEDEVQNYINSTQTIEYAHTLEDQIQGQIDVGFVISGFYEDDFGGSRILDKHIKTFVATRAMKERVTEVEQQLNLKEHIYSLETTLLQEEVRKSVERLKELIADDFVEYSSTGEIYNKESVLNRLPYEDDPQITMINFELKYLSPTSALTTFKVFIKSKMKYSLRSSVWQLNDGKWQMTFHQGTVTKQ